jgi:chromosome partitioning protein
MKPEGYILMQHLERMARPVKACRKWVDRIPGTYRESVLGSPPGSPPVPADDGNCLAHLTHYRSLVPMAREVLAPDEPSGGAGGSGISGSGALSGGHSDGPRVTAIAAFPAP